MDDFNKYDLINFLQQEGLQFTDRGKELMLHRCPFCETDRQKKSDHFSFNTAEGVYNCVKCNAAGNFVTFQRELGYDPFKHKIYRKPDQKKAEVYRTQADDYYAAYEKKRGIPAEILKKYGVGKAESPGLGMCRTYQYLDEAFEVVNIKYVNAKKQMRTESSAKRVYYGMQFLDYEKDTLHITEGEDDCHALVALGFDNCVSVPYGAGNYSEEMGAANKRFKKIILFFDNDQKGQEGAEKFAQKAGPWKCWNVVLPYKDVRDCLLNGKDIFDFQQYVKIAKQFAYDESAKYRPAKSIQERLDAFEFDCKRNTRGVLTGYKLFDDVTGGMRGGELYTIVADPGCYKTTMLMNLCKRVVENNTHGITLFFSMEMPLEAAAEREWQIYEKIDRPWVMREGAATNNEAWRELRRKLENSAYGRIWVSDEPGLSLDGIVKVCESTTERADTPINFIAIDYLDFIQSDKGREYEVVKEVMNGLKVMARKLFVPVLLLCQTNRGHGSDTEVGARSGKGGTSIESASDYSIGLWSMDDDASFDGQRIIYGRFTKHRRLMQHDRPFPYFQLEISARTYEITDFKECEKPRPKKYSGDDL
jgi:5S rRNA maturation endonuclease (ribonuclease M5)/KaiC/GvpD/RAD55 family RecA-like ATPase